MKRTALMVVMNRLDTDARVKRAAEALSDSFNLQVVGVNIASGSDKYAEIILHNKYKRRILKYFEFVSSVKKIINKEAKNLSLVYLHDYYTAYLVKWLKRKYPGIKVVYDAHEVIIPEQGKKQAKREKFFYTFEKNAVKLCDLFICASPIRAVLLMNHYHLNTMPLSIENISELPLVVDDISNGILNDIDQAIGLENNILVYAGAITISRKIEKLVEIIEKNPMAKLLVVGDGEYRKNLEEICSSKIAGRFYFTGGVPYKYLGAILKKCAVGFISYPNDTLNNTYCAPNKIYEYASVCLPMIAPPNVTLDKFFEKYSIGVTGEDLSKAFSDVFSDIPAYKENCQIFSEQNPWAKQKGILLDAVLNLYE